MQYIDRKEFQEQLGLCNKITSPKTNVLICKTVKLTTATDSLVMCVTNLKEAYISSLSYEGEGAKQYQTLTSVPVLTKELAGRSVCVPVSSLMKALKAIPKKVKKVPVEILDKTCCGDRNISFKLNGTLTIIGQDPEDFPSLPKIPFGGYHKILDIEGIGRIKNAAAKTGYREFIKGIYFDFDNENMAATNGHRIHLTDLAKFGIGSFIMSNGAIGFLWAARKDTAQWLAQDKANIYVQMKHGIFISRKAEDEFPDYDMIIQAIPTSYFWAKSKAEFADILGEAAAILDKDHVEITLCLNSCVIVKSQNLEIGEFEKVFNSQYIYQGPPIEISLDIQYLADAMKQIPNDEGFMMQFVGIEDPVLIETMDKNFRAYVSPLRRE